MKKKGFTLVELLAVIVILAIIAIIATPIILNVIETARKNAAKSSALGYIDALEKQIIMDQVNATSIISSNGIVDVPISNLSVKGQAPNSGWIEISNRQIKSYSIVIGNYVITDGKVSEGTTAATKPEEDAVVVELENCSPVGHTPTAYNYGDEYSCTVGEGIIKTFYILEDGDNTTINETDVGKVSLIMNNNVGSQVSWHTDIGTSSWEEVVANGPVAALAELSSQTANWSVPVSLPSDYQITQANGGSEVDMGSNPWLGANLAIDDGYWLSTPDPNNENYVYMVWKSTNGIGVGSNTYATNYYVRPVITVSKK